MTDNNECRSLSCDSKTEHRNKKKKKNLVNLAHRICNGSFGGKNERAIVFCFYPSFTNRAANKVSLLSYFLPF